MKFVGDNDAFLTIVLCSGECVVRMVCVRVSVRVSVRVWVSHV